MTTDLDCYPRARNTDPHTSHIAGRDIANSGIAGLQRKTVLLNLRRYASEVPRTSAELAKIANLDRFMVARRLPELERSGDAARNMALTCPVTGRKSITWRAISPDAGQRRMF